MLYNIRFPKMWEIITPHIDFYQKVVLNLGAGYGDTSKAIMLKGGVPVSVDKKKLFEGDVIISDLNNWTKEGFSLPKGVPDNPDIIICFSVLPYLKDPQGMMRLFLNLAPTTLIECQYRGDGPGFEFIKNDADMKKWFQRIGWNQIEKLGETYIPGRDKSRSIWLLGS